MGRADSSAFQVNRLQSFYRANKDRRAPFRFHRWDNASAASYSEPELGR